MFPFSDDTPTLRTPLVNYAIIALNVIVFLWMLTLSDLDRVLLSIERGFVPVRLTQAILKPGLPIAIDLQETGDSPHVPNDARLPRREVVRLPTARGGAALTALTCMFLHGGWMHLLGNMWFLFIFGDNIEDRLGHGLYLAFYLFGGVVATGCHWLLNLTSDMPVIGASGAIAAVLGAYAITYPKARVKTLVFLVFLVFVWELPALVVLGFWFVGQVLEAGHQIRSGIDGGVALFAHIGGFLFGLCAMPWLPKHPPVPVQVFYE